MTPAYESALVRATYRRNPDMVFADLGAELAVLDLPRGSYLGFNTTAAAVWRLLEQPVTLERICDAMVCEFEVDPGRCRTEVGALLASLLQAGLVTGSDEPLA